MEKDSFRLQKNYMQMITDAGEHGGIHFCNNSRFVTTYAPSVLGDAWENGEYWGWSAATVKSKGLGWVTASWLQRFSADYKTVEKSMPICADIRYFENEPDVWMANGYTGGNVVTTNTPIRQNRLSTINITTMGNSIRISTIPSNTKVSVVDTRGRTIATHSSKNIASLDVNDLDPGMYAVILNQENYRVSNLVTVAE